MFQRKALENLRTWSNKSNRKPLILRGARQVGKTTLINGFSKEFETFLSLNLDRPNEKALFEREDSAENLLTSIYLQKNKSKKEGRTLLFIDEIQNSSRAVAFLRYFYEDLPELYVIAAGSLLESLIDNQLSFPVGRVEYMALRPCSFTEFLDAMDENALKQAIESVSVPAVLHNKVMRLFNEFVLVGGMPEAVASYAQNKDIVALNDIYETLLTGYRDDAEKYAKGNANRQVLRYILEHGWSHAGERIRFDKFASSNYRSREMGDAFRTLEKAMLLELVYPATTSTLPVQPDHKKSPKLLWFDTGLVNYVSNFQKELFVLKDISDAWKGRIAEHIVGQELIASDRLVSVRRCFWVREAKNAQSELDFLYVYNGRVLPIEVKSGYHSKLKSLHWYMESSLETIALRFWGQSLSTDTIKLPSGKTFTLYSLPFYYAGVVEVFLNRVFDSGKEKMDAQPYK
jgi:uncharacterized protein